MKKNLCMLLAAEITVVLSLAACASNPSASGVPTVGVSAAKMIATVTPSTLTPMPPTDRPSPIQTNLPTTAPDPAPVYRPAFGIDYTHPDIYTSQGQQTMIADASALEALLQSQKNHTGMQISMLGEIYKWEKAGYQAYSAGGRTIGVVTVDQLMKERRMGGCHDWGLVFAAVTRQLGYPAVMVDTVSIAWVRDHLAGQNISYLGHVFVEVYVDGRWVLVDPTNNWVVADGYDPANPVIPLKGNIAGDNNEAYGFYVMRKGLDNWDYGIRSNAALQELMRNTASQLDLSSLTIPEYTFSRFGN